jgi:uncharacterized protein (DUF433 family)
MHSKRLSRSVRLQQTTLGCYTAARAAALSGVPRDRLQSWARSEVVVPSVARVRERLWSYTDLLALRLTWLRTAAGRRRRLPDPREELRHALAALADWAPDHDEDSDDPPAPLLADLEGNLALGNGAADAAWEPGGTWPEGTWVDLFASFEVAGAHGPHLVRPRPNLRIVPGKVAGEPHLSGTRLTTLSVATLARRGLSLDEIAGLFPDQQRVALGEAIDLEDELTAGAHGDAA